MNGGCNISGSVPESDTNIIAMRVTNHNVEHGSSSISSILKVQNMTSGIPF
jgi:hypothetical protein